jgi:hypothetical protein
MYFPYQRPSSLNVRQFPLSHYDRFVVLSPCAFIAGNYILLGRLSRHLNTGSLLAVSPTRITRIFVASDITTFLIQATGGSISTANDINTAITGSHIFLAGLVLQLASYTFFTCVYLVWLTKVYKNKEVWEISKTFAADGTPLEGGNYRWWRDWRALAGALILSCIGILVRQSCLRP